jgi:hypothetical protein
MTLLRIVPCSALAALCLCAAKSRAQTATTEAVTARATAYSACDPEHYGAQSKPGQLAIDSAFKTEPRLEEMRVTLHAPEKKVRDKVKVAMLACNMPLTRAGGGVYEADYGMETTHIARYALTTHIVVVAMDDTTTVVRLSGTETERSGDAHNASAETNPISNKNKGRSALAWLALRNVALQLRADSTLAPDLGASTPIAAQR